MLRHVTTLLLLLILAGCGVQPAILPSTAPATQGETPAEAAMMNRLNQLLEQCLAAAKKAAEPAEAEVAARTVFERWKKAQKGDFQFHVQAQRLARGGMQIQLQVQMTDGMVSLQAQRQASFGR